MDRRLSQIADILRSEVNITPDELASRMGVSTRTIRTYIGRLNDLLTDKGHVEMRSESFYHADDDVLNALENLLELSAKSDAGECIVPDSFDGRITYLMNDLLNRSAWITIDELAGILFVSRATISEDLKEVEKRLSRFDLTLDRRPRYGVRVAGSELKRRLCLATLVVGAGDEKVGGSLVDRETVRTVDSCVQGVFRNANYQANSIVYQNLLVHITIAIRRIKDGCYVPLENEQLERIKATQEFSVARAVARRIETAFDVTLPQEEIAYVAIHLAARQRLFFSVDADENSPVITDDVWQIVGEMLERIWENFRFDFRNDLELRMTLAQHVVPLSVRLRFHMRMDNPLLSDIRRRYPLAWIMACDASSVLEDAYEATLSDEEKGYIALAFALALERLQGKPIKKNVLIVCASGAGSARLLELRYRNEFNAYLNRIETCDMMSIDKVDLSGIDYVFTTVPLHIQLPIPVLEVGFFLDEGDIKSVRTMLKRDITPGFQREVERFYSENLFLPHIKAKDRLDAIHQLCCHVSTERLVPNNFEELVLERERAAQTSFGNQVAIPHPVKPVTRETFVCVGLLEEPVEWNGVSVSAVFLLSISKDHMDDLQRFYRSFGAMLTDGKSVNELISQRRYETLLNLLRSHDIE